VSQLHIPTEKIDHDDDDTDVLSRGMKYELQCPICSWVLFFFPVHDRFDRGGKSGKRMEIGRLEMFPRHKKQITKEMAKMGMFKGKKYALEARSGIFTATTQKGRIRGSHC
jgi:hypothetical protein